MLLQRPTRTRSHLDFRHHAVFDTTHRHCEAVDARREMVAQRSEIHSPRKLVARLAACADDDCHENTGPYRSISPNRQYFWLPSESVVAHSPVNRAARPFTAKRAADSHRHAQIQSAETGSEFRRSYTRVPHYGRGPGVGRSRRKRRSSQTSRLADGPARVPTRAARIGADRSALGANRLSPAPLAHTSIEERNARQSSAGEGRAPRVEASSRRARLDVRVP